MATTACKIRRLLRDTSGATAVEYAVLLTMIALFIGVLSLAADEIKATFSTVASAVSAATGR